MSFRFIRKAQFLFLLSIVLAASFPTLAQEAGGGTLVRDVLGGAALIFRRPDNPPTASGGRLPQDAVSTDSRNKEQVIARANAARNAPTPRYSEAEEGYRLAARIDPTDPRAYAGLGNVYIDQRRFAPAAEAYRDALKLRPGYPLVLMPLGFAYVGLNKFTDAIDIYQTALRVQPDDPEIYNNLGYVYNQLEKYDDSIAACERAIELLGETGRAYKLGLQERNEVLAHAYKNLGNAFSGQKRYPAAIDALRHATALEPTNAAAFFNLGLAHYSAGQYREAVEAYQEVLKLKPNLAVAHYNLGLAYVALQDRTAALAEYNVLKGLHPQMAAELHKVLPN